MHSLNGEDWETIAFLPGAGNSTQRTSYKVVDYQPEKAINYYQLSQTDHDGSTVSYSPISIDNRNEKRKIISIINILGQAINENYRGLIIIYYDDGTHEKKYQ